MHEWSCRPFYGTKIQYADQPDASTILPTKDIKHLQQIVGTLLY
jgi:hypothetical protein